MQNFLIFIIHASMNETQQIIVMNSKFSIFNFPSRSCCYCCWWWKLDGGSSKKKNAIFSPSQSFYLFFRFWFVASWWMEDDGTDEMIISLIDWKLFCTRNEKWNLISIRVSSEFQLVESFSSARKLIIWKNLFRFNKKLKLTRVLKSSKAFFSQVLKLFLKLSIAF